MPRLEYNNECYQRFDHFFEAGQTLILKLIDDDSGEVVREEMVSVVEAPTLTKPIIKPLTDRHAWIEGTVDQKISINAQQFDDQAVFVMDEQQNKLCEAHINYDGTFSCQLKGLLPAGTTVYVTQTADGYYPSEATAVTVVRTFAEPAPPIIIVPPSDVKPGTPILHPVTSDALSLTGAGTPGLVVKAWNEFGFRLGEATVSPDGSFRVPLERELPQDIGIRVVQLQDGKMSDGAQTYVRAGENVKLKMLDTVTDTSTRLSGHLERMSFTPIRVELRQGKTILATDETTFFFRLDFKPQTEPLTLALIYANGHETAQTIHPIDTTAPKLATVSTLTNRSTRVFGRAEAGSTIIVHHNKKRLTTTVSSAGIYSLNLPQLTRGDVVSVQAIDATGNTSSTIKRTVLGVQTKLTTTATPRLVTGKGEPGALVRVFVGTKMIGKTVKVDVKGTYRVTIPAQVKGKSLFVTQKKTGYVKQTQSVIVK
ncbi:Ig-like domain-containing protein [Exiguobacterium sp. SH0S2]|uniref:Ig-like domain-containing protein n=1 Tax=Exiguobacterium sp. SH0S2 TaxID=2510950 RepID=UPI001375841F|nr:Ig-like domain-containing protein [Exiguobacterium sp. SH0S2]